MIERPDGSRITALVNIRPLRDHRGRIQGAINCFQDGQPVFPVARALRGRNIPFIFRTGYGATGLPAEFCDAPVVGKPFDLNSLRDAISVGLMNHKARKTFTG